jgi:tetratricopeptide (TPR) repeat protein
MTQADDIYLRFSAHFAKNHSLHFPTYLKKFGALKTHLDRMNFVFTDFEKVDSIFKIDEKTDAAAVEHRKKGNIFYHSDDYRNALDCYTASIMTAKSVEVLALAYGNRSAALLKLNLYRECLTDIERALQNGYPDDLKPKLIARRQYCEVQQVEPKKYYQPPPKISESERNPLIQSAKNCVKIVKNVEWGRHVVATRDIKIGEVLAVESAYASVTSEDTSVHCHECLDLCYNPIPCDKCTQTLYCNATCKDKAFSYHQYECLILFALSSKFVRFAKRLALKTVLVARNEWKNCDTDSDRSEEEYHSDRFKEISHFLTHTHLRSKHDLLSQTIVACQFYYLLKNHTSFLNGDINEDRLKEVLLIMVLICMSHAIVICEQSSDLKIGQIGEGIFSFCDLFNHSCCPNVMGYNHGTTIVLRANNAIKKGEQCFLSYGPNYMNSNLDVRQQILMKIHFFTCKCRPCQENWPTVPEMESLFSAWTEWQLKNADINQAKNKLQQLLKIAEEKDPTARDSEIKNLLRICFSIFGNRRQI